MKGKVQQLLEDSMRTGAIHFTLIDPDKTRGMAAGTLARQAEEMGSSCVLLGGSTGITPAIMTEAARSVHSMSNLPVVIFPQGPESITGEADALLFMSLLNSRNVKHVIRLQAKASVYVRNLGIETIPTGYLIVAPGMKVGEVGDADCIEREDNDGACGYALAAEMLGMRLIYAEAGSGAPAPVPGKMIASMKKALKIPLMVGGGIRTQADVRSVLDAGADAIVTGTVVEQEGQAALKRILDEVKNHRGG